jgi:hypothetical protein
MLDGLCGALIYAWPGPIYEGNGECQGVIDERADAKQRDALATIYMVAKRMRGRRTGGYTARCRAQSILRCSSPSSST